MDALTAGFDISTHALREEGDLDDAAAAHKTELISTHALREEGDQGALVRPGEVQISTHALREEGDAGRRRCGCDRSYFYPRPP